MEAGNLRLEAKATKKCSISKVLTITMLIMMNMKFYSLNNPKMQKKK